MSVSTLIKRVPFRKLSIGQRPFTPEERREVLLALERGEGLRAVAKRFRRPRLAITLLRNQFRAERRAEIFKARAQGLSYARIGRQFGLSHSGVLRIAKAG